MRACTPGPTITDPLEASDRMSIVDPIPGVSTPPAPLTANEPGATYRVVRAAKDHHCGDGAATYPHPCRRTIKKGEQYVRSVQFKNHDCYAWVDRDTHLPLTRPIVTDLCFECARQYHTTDLLVIAAERAARGGAA